MKKIHKILLFITFLIFITSNISSNNIEDELLKIINNSIVTTVYTVDDYGDHIPLAIGTITHFDDITITIMESDNSLGSIDINRDDIMYIITNEYSTDSSVIYFKEGFGFQQELFNDSEVEYVTEGFGFQHEYMDEAEFEPDYIFMEDPPEYTVPVELIPDVLDIKNLLELLYENKKNIVITGFDDTISVTTLADGSIINFDDESLTIINKEQTNTVSIVYRDILYIEIESSNDYWEYYKVIVNSDLSISFQQ